MRVPGGSVPSFRWWLSRLSIAALLISAVLAVAFGSRSFAPRVQSNPVRQEEPAAGQPEVEELVPPLMSEGETAALRAQLAEAQQAATMYGPYWTLEEGFESEMVVSNAVDKRLSMLLTLFARDGTPFDLPGMILGPHAVHHIRLRDVIDQAGLSAELGGQSGGLRLRHSGTVPTMIAAQVGVTNRAGRLSFDVPVEPPKETSSRLEGVFGLFDDKTQVNIILTNFSDQVLPVTWRITGEKGLTVSDERALASHEMLRLPATELLKAATGSPGKIRAGGVSIEYQGRPGSLKARGLIFNQSLGLSSSFGFIDPATQQLSELEGTGLILHGSQLDGLHPGAKLESWVVLRNAGAERQTTTPTVWLTERASVRPAQLPSILLEPQETRRINLSEELKRARAVSPHLSGAGIELKYTGSPGSLVALCYSVLASASQVFDVPLRDMTTSRTNAWNYPWLLDEEYNTIVYISNTISEERRPKICLMFPGGGGYQLDLAPLQGGETRAIDLRQLRATAEPDVNGDRVPLEQGRGMFMWKERRPGLIGRALIYSAGGGMSHNLSCASEPLATACIRIGGSAFSSSCSNSPSSLSGNVGQGVSVSVFEVLVGCCSGEFFKALNITASAQISSFNPLVVQVIGNQLQFVGAGQTAVEAEFDEWQAECGCDPSFIPPVEGPVCSCIEFGSQFQSFFSPLLGVQVVVCPVPVNFRQVGGAQNVGGSMVLTYKWDSSTGKLTDLANVEIGERVDYPPNNCGGGLKYCWPSPPWALSAVSDNPTIINGPGTAGEFTDTHESKSFRTPYQAASFTATQVYRYRTPCANNGDWVTLKGPLDIVRSVSQKPDGQWKYTITKDGNSLSIDPLP